MNKRIKILCSFMVVAQDVELTATEVKAQILNTATQVSSLSGYCVSGGYLNAAAALGG